MTTTIRQTDQYEFFRDIFGNTAILDTYTGSQTSWNTGDEARKEINHIRHLDNEQFDKYCSDIINKREMIIKTKTKWNIE